MVNDIDYNDDIYFSEEYSIKEITPGSIIFGKVIAVNKEYVTMDIKWKSEGRAPISDFLNLYNNINVSVGDEYQVVFKGISSGEDLPLLSKKEADLRLSFDRLTERFKEELPVEGKITKLIKGGYEVDIGHPAFLPLSHTDIKYVKEPKEYVGKVLIFKIIELDVETKNIVISRKLFLKEEKERQKNELLKKLHPGLIVKGKVESIVDYGAFVDIGGVTGLLHSSNISWGRDKTPQKYISKGDVLKLKVLEYDEEKQRISLGLKQLLENPWNTIFQRYQVNDAVEVEIMEIRRDGIIVQLEPGIEGLIPVNEISWTSYIDHPTDMINGSTKQLKAIIISIDTETKKLELSLRQLEPNPWLAIEDKYPVGSNISGKVYKLLKDEAIIELEENVHAHLSIKDLSYLKKYTNFNNVLKVGDELEAKILSVDTENYKIQIGVKQLLPNPWTEIYDEFPPGSHIKVKIVSVANFGAFAKLPNGIEGLIPISNIAMEKISDINSRIAVGDEVFVKVLSINLNEQRVSLSIKEYLKDKERETIDQYTEEKNQTDNSLGNLLSDKLESLKKSIDE